MTEELALQGSHEIRFKGDEIYAVSDSLDMTEWDERHLNLQLFSNELGGFVAAIEFHTKANHELDFCLVEPSLSLGEIPELLACQDPTEHIDRNQLRKQNSGDSDRFIKAVYHDYDALSIEIERQLESFVPCRPEAPIARKQEPKKSVWSSWNPFSSDKQHS